MQRPGDFGGRALMKDIPKQDDDLDLEQRLKAILQGTFSGPPTPLKDIPTRGGESRKLAHKNPQRRFRRQRKKRAA
jgi:hypothetical protein